MHCCGAAAFATGLAVLTLSVAPHSRRTLLVGVIADIFNVAMFASPLSAMRGAWLAQSTAGLPGLLSLVMLVCAGTWTAYGAYQADASILVPNALGTAVTLLQCCLYAHLSRGSGKRDGAAAGSDPADELQSALLSADEEDEQLSTAVVVDWVV